MGCGQGEGEFEQDGRDDDQHLATAGGKHEQDEFFQIVVNRTPFAHGTGNGGEIVVSQDHGGGFLGSLGALQPHGHTDIGAFQRRRVVYPVAGHGDDLTLFLHRLDQSQLVLRRGTREYIDTHDHLAQGGIVHQGDFGAAEGRFARANCQLCPDCACRFDVVAGNHLDPDAGAVAVVHRLHGFRPGRIDDADQGQQHEAAVHVGKTKCPVLQCRPFAGQRQQAQPLSSGVVDQAPPVINRQRLFAAMPGAVVTAVFHLRAAHREDALWRAFDEQPWGIVAVAVVGGHEAVLRFERQGIKPGPGSVAQVATETGFFTQHQQSAFGRVTFDPPHAIFHPQPGIVAQHAGTDGQRQDRVVFAVDDAVVQTQIAHRRVADAADIEDMAGADDALHGHFVAGQGAGFIGADDRHRAQRFDRRQATDDGVVPRHALHAQRQGDGHDCRQAFGNGRSNQRHHHHEHVGRVVVAPPCAERKHCQRYGEDDQGQDAAKVIHLAQQGGACCINTRQHLVDFAQFCGGSGGDDDPGGLPIHHQRARVGHVAAVAQRRIRGDERRAFFDRQRFAGQRRFLDA